MSEAAALAINAKLAKLGQGSALKGKGGDRLFKAHGRKWRVRVRVLDEIAPAAPVDGTPDLSPDVVSLSISVAAVGRGDKVAKDESGRFLVFAASSLTLQGEAFAAPDFDPQREILIAVADQIAAANAQIKGRSRLPAALSAWQASDKMRRNGRPSVIDLPISQGRPDMPKPDKKPDDPRPLDSPGPPPDPPPPPPPPTPRDPEG